MSNNITNPNPSLYSNGPYYTRTHFLPVTYTLNFKDINNNVVYTYRLNPNNHGNYNTKTNIVKCKLLHNT